MAKSLAQITIDGHVGGAMVARQAGSATVYGFSVATNTSRKVGEGEWADDTTWWTIDCWGAEPLGVVSGASVTIVGEFSLARDKNGVILYKRNKETNEITAPYLKIKTSKYGIVVHGPKREAG